MRVILTIDATDYRDIVLRDDIQSWLLNSDQRGAWTVCETEEDDGRILLSYTFDDILDASDLYYRQGVTCRARRV
jgi:hypothetical protein